MNEGYFRIIAKVVNNSWGSVVLVKYLPKYFLAFSKGFSF
jgi:hypothetical protein